MIRCLIVDDSPAFRGVLRGILASAAGVEVVGEAGDGEEATARTLELKPNVITMDVQMPKRNGLEAIREIMRVAPTPIVVISALIQGPGEGIAFQALKLGAIEVLEKPQALEPARLASQAEAIRMAVRSVAGLKLITRHRDRPEPPTPVRVIAPPCTKLPLASGLRLPRCIGITASTGGPPALQRILSVLPGDLPVPVLVVQHIATGFTEGMVRWLAEQCALKVRIAVRGEPLEAGVVLFAPDDKHLMVSMGRVRLDEGPAVKGLRPSGTILLASLAREFGPAAVGLVLTGMGDDGTAGLKLMRERGAVTLAQGPASSVVYGMPRVALESGAAAQALELEDIPASLIKLVYPLEPSPSSSAANGGGTGSPVRKKLLLADDAETVLQMERGLFGAEFELVLARNGKEAVEAAQQHRPDAILLDHRMPLMNGAQVLQALRSEPATRSIPVIMVSSETEKNVVDSWWEGGCQAVVSKPIDKQLLMGTVRRLLVGNQP
jgi:two-component system chemotaxis response regulator CheB